MDTIKQDLIQARDNFARRSANLRNDIKYHNDAASECAIAAAQNEQRAAEYDALIAKLD